MLNTFIRPISDLNKVDFLTADQAFRILMSQRAFCVIVDKNVHLVDDAYTLIRKKYKERNAWEVYIYQLHE